MEILTPKRGLVFMYFWWSEIFNTVFCQSYATLIVFCMACALLIISAVIGYKVKSTGVYSAFVLLVYGGACIAVLTQTLTGKSALYLTAGFTVVSGALYLTLWLILTIKESITRRRAQRKEIERKLKFTLPERENSFVQARLNTALHPDAEKLQEQESQALPLSHAWDLLAKLREKQLTTADRLASAELAAFLSLYKEKETWTIRESQAVNDALAGVLKLSAKYSA